MNCLEYALNQCTLQERTKIIDEFAEKCYQDYFKPHFYIDENGKHISPKEWVFKLHQAHEDDLRQMNRERNKRY